MKTNTLRFYMTRSFEEMTDLLKELEEEGKISMFTALVLEPEDFYCAPISGITCKTPRRRSCSG